MSGLNLSSSAPLKNGGNPPQELLDDLCSRFVLNVPKEDQQSFERILFLVEYAHWFYEDNSVENNPSLKSFTLKEFTSLSQRMKQPREGKEASSHQDAAESLVSRVQLCHSARGKFQHYKVIPYLKAQICNGDGLHWNLHQ
ncbi:hypothetical protein Tsubulata_038844 [Turnera subulata]|uniref:mRNA decapping protein 2 Box A domain-containing protein n=1 Tax=Turnera subulata TaxID=218843 RepID=A0A9Q0GFC1_9ROSI|nr:hypothetical protein Tsubulata_038844 [Turnera subulata]